MRCNLGRTPSGRPVRARAAPSRQRVRRDNQPPCSAEPDKRVSPHPARAPSTRPTCHHAPLGFPFQASPPEGFLSPVNPLQVWWITMSTIDLIRLPQAFLTLPMCCFLFIIWARLCLYLGSPPPLNRQRAWWDYGHALEGEYPPITTNCLPIARYYPLSPPFRVAPPSPIPQHFPEPGCHARKRIMRVTPLEVIANADDPAINSGNQIHNIRVHAQPHVVPYL